MLISFEKLLQEYKLNVSGIFHIGGHFAEEAWNYQTAGIENVIFFEPVTESFKVCKENAEGCGYQAFNLALGKEDKVVDMFTETVNGGQSSSVLKPKLHLEQYPHIVFDGKQSVKMTSLDSFVGDIDLSKFNMINMDVQGYELEVLKGAEKTLNHIDCVYSEVNNDEVYEGCAHVDELDSFLSSYGFTRTVTDWAGETWGDALYVK